MSGQPTTKYPNAPDIESSTFDYVGRFRGEIGRWLLDHQTDPTIEAISTLCLSEGEINSDNANSPSIRNISVLDVGGGHGQNIETINRFGFRLTVFGSTGSSAEVIKQYIEAEEITYDSGALLSLPYRDNSFDIVICYRLLSHMENWQGLIRELSRVSNRIVLVDYPNKGSVNLFADLLFLLKRMVEKNTRHFICFTDHDIDSAFSQCGCEQQYRHRQFFFPMAFYRLIKNKTIADKLARMFRAIGLTDRFGSPVIAGYVKSGNH